VSDRPDSSTVIALYVFSGPHLGARLELTAGTWLLGSDDACDLILQGLEPRHAVLDIVAEDNGEKVALLPLDGGVRLHDREESPSAEPVRLTPQAGEIWYLGLTCLVWNKPDVLQCVPEPEAAFSLASTKTEQESGGVSTEPVPGNEMGSTEVALQTENANIAGSDADSLPVALTEATPQKKRLHARFVLLGLVTAFLIIMSAVLTPAEKPEQYPALVEQYLKDANIHGLIVTSRDPGVEVRGSVEDDAAMLRLRDVARALHFPVYLEVGVQEDILRAVRSSLGIRGFRPEVRLEEGEAGQSLSVAVYMKDSLLEEAAFTALTNEVRGLPQIRRRIVHETELAPVLEKALKDAGLPGVRPLFLPGRVDFVGDFGPEDREALLRVRREAEKRLNIPLPGQSTESVPSLSASVREQSPSPVEPTGSVAQDDEDGDPLGGLRVTGVTMQPMRFVTTADGRRLFEGAVLPGGATLESISTTTLTLRKGGRVFTHRLRGAP